MDFKVAKSSLLSPVGHNAMWECWERSSWVHVCFKAVIRFCQHLKSIFPHTRYYFSTWHFQKNICDIRSEMLLCSYLKEIVENSGSLGNFKTLGVFMSQVLPVPFPHPHRGVLAGVLVCFCGIPYLAGLCLHRQPFWPLQFCFAYPHISQSSTSKLNCFIWQDLGYQRPACSQDSKSNLLICHVRRVSQKCCLVLWPVMARANPGHGEVMLGVHSQTEGLLLLRDSSK